MADTDELSVLSELLHAEGELIKGNQPAGRVEELLDTGFVEFGASGRVWSREAILNELLLRESRTYTIDDVAGEMLADGVALLTYRVTVAGAASLRSSIWRLRSGAWRMVFHQGTRIP